MPSWLQNLVNNPRLIVFLIVAAVTVGGQIVKKVNQAKAERERKLRAEQAELNRLRTGGSAAGEPARQPLARPAQHTPMMPAPEAAAPASGPTQRQASLEEIAEARRRKIEELRRKQRVAGGPGVSSQPAARTQQAGTRTVQLPNGITIEVPASAAPPPVPPVPPASRTVPPRQPVRRTQPVARSQPPQPVASPAPHTSVTETERGNAAAYAESAAPQVAIQAPKQRGATPSAARGFATLLGAADRAAVRRAVVLSEVLGSPMSARP